MLDEEIRVALARRKQRHIDAAIEIGVSRPTFHAWTHGNFAGLKVRHLRAIARWLDITDEDALALVPEEEDAVNP